MLASGEEIDLKDLFISAVIMLSGAMITMLGISFGTDNEDDRTNDLQDAITELTGMLNTLQTRLLWQREQTNNHKLYNLEYLAST